MHFYIQRLPPSWSSFSVHKALKPVQKGQNTPFRPFKKVSTSTTSTVGTMTLVTTYIPMIIVLYSKGQGN